MIRIFAAGLLAVPFAAVAADPVPRAGTPLQLAVVSDGVPSRLDILVEIDGKPLSAIWDDTFAKLAVYCDRDGNGSLDEKEAARLPDAVVLRQVLGTGFTPPTGVPPSFADLDTDRDGKVSPSEMVGYYRNRGLGSAVIGVGRMPHGAELTKALLSRIDANGDGKTTEAEWKAAASALAKLDANDDELIGAGELVPKAIYPGASGSVLLSSSPSEISALDPRFAFPAVLLPTDPSDERWATEWFRRRQPAPAPTVEAFLATRKVPKVATWIVRFGDEQPATERFIAKVGQLRIECGISEGKLPGLVAGVRKQMVASLDGPPVAVEPATDGTGGRRRGSSGIAWLTPIADRNADGKLDRAELDAWLDLQEQIARGHVLITLLDGGGPFELLDENHDGALSPRELQNAWARFVAAGCTTDGILDAKKSPRVVLATASRGYPARMETRRGPVWFRAMDRNGDGDVSRKEFAGDPESFDKLDADKDGILTPDEAGKAGK